MKELLTYVARNLVDHPDQVSVTEGAEQDGVITYNLTVAEEDKGYVIGKQGKVAKAIRAIVKTAAIKENKKVRVYIV